VNYLASKAKTAGELLTLMTVIVPIALVVIGVVLLVIAIMRRHQPAAAPPPPRPHPQPAPPRATRRSRRAAGWTAARHTDAPSRAQHPPTTPVARIRSPAAAGNPARHLSQ